MRVLARITMLLLIVGMGGVVASSRAQTRPAPQFKSNPGLSEEEKRGEHWFLQNCSLCHLAHYTKDDPGGSPPGGNGPGLQRLLQDAGPEREKAVRGIIMHGTPKMPGFQYALEARDLDDLIAYLRTL
jgi:mono/diheme cytochrome c family protein